MPGPQTNIVFGLLVGAGIDQKLRTVRVTTHSGTNQRRLSDLRIEVAATRTAQWKNRRNSTEKR